MEIIIADNGKMAIEKINETDDINLIVMDIMMPVMNGYDSIKTIRQHHNYKDKPIIALTANAMQDDQDKCIETGAKDYLSTPVDSDELLKMINLWLNK